MVEIMASKKELYYRLLAVNIDEATTQALCDYFDTSVLIGFVEHIEEEFGDVMGGFDEYGD